MAVPILLTDVFARANNDVNTGFQAYVETPATTWSVVSNQLVSATNPAFLAAQVFAPADARVFGIEANTVGVWGVFARGGGTYNGGSDTYYRADLNGTTLTLRKSVSGTLTTIQTATVTRTAGAALILDCIGTELQVWYNGVIVIDTADSAIAGSLSGKSCGLWNGSTTQVQISRFDVRGDNVYPLSSLLYNAFTTWKHTREWSNEQVEYLSGFVQRNQLWKRGRNSATFGQEYLPDADKALVQQFFDQCRGMWQPFLVQDPTWSILQLQTGKAISAEQFAVADGVSTVYKVNVDKAASITTYTDGVLDASQPTKSLLQGILFYASPPYAGARLTYDALTPYYRVYWAKDQVTWERKTPDYWVFNEGVIQDKVLELGLVM